MRFQCSACGQQVKVADMLAGKMVRCPSCRTTVQVPSASAPSSAPPSRKLEADDSTDGPKLSDFGPPVVVQPTLSDDDETFGFQPTPPPPPIQPPPFPMSQPPIPQPPPVAGIANAIASDDDDYRLAPLPPPIPVVPPPLPPRKPPPFPPPAQGTG